MPAIERGRVCFISRGRRTGKKAVISEVNENIATIIVDGKKKKCSIRHLFPTSEIVDVSKLEKTTTERKEPKKKEK